MRLKFLESRVLSSSRDQVTSGFTLLEVVIAMAIMALAFGAILAVEGSSINASARAKQMNIVAMLAKNQMIETEYKIEGKTFDEVKKEDQGTFEEPYQDFKWKTVVKELKFPNIGSGGAGKGAASSAAGGSDQTAELVTKLMTNFLTKSIREVTVTILWKRGSGEQTFSLATYWVDLNHAFELE